MPLSIEDVYNDLIKRERFKARYSTRASGSYRFSKEDINVVIDFDCHANMSFTTGPRDIIDGVPAWKFEATYEFSLHNHKSTMGYEDGQATISLLSEANGSGSARVNGFLKAVNFFDNSVALIASLDPAPLQALSHTDHFKNAGDSGPEETTETITHDLFFGQIDHEQPALSPYLDVYGLDFRKAAFTTLRSWETKETVYAPYGSFFGLDVVFFQEIAITDGDVLPSSDDRIPIIEVVEESGGTPVAGKIFNLVDSYGNASTHVSDDRGQVRLYVTDDEQYIVASMEEHPEKSEAHHTKTEIS